MSEHLPLVGTIELQDLFDSVRQLVDDDTTYVAETMGAAVVRNAKLQTLRDNFAPFRDAVPSLTEALEKGHDCPVCRYSTADAHMRSIVQVMASAVSAMCEAGAVMSASFDELIDRGEEHEGDSRFLVDLIKAEAESWEPKGWIRRRRVKKILDTMRLHAEAMTRSTRPVISEHDEPRA